MDIKLHYTEQGEGDPLILLHGNGEDGTYFVHQTSHFSKTRRVIAVDTRGHGKSPRGTAPFGIRQFAEDLRAFLDELQIEQADILGFSDGGNIALTFAILSPERVRRLILNGANLNPGGVKPSVQIPIVIGYHITSLFAGKSAKARNHAELLGLMVHDPDIGTEELKKVRAKTLVIVGTKDMIRESHTRQIYDHLPDASLVILPVDHFIANKNPDRYNRPVEAFLRE